MHHHHFIFRKVLSSIFTERKKKAMGADETPGISAENLESIQHLSALKTAIKINSTCIKHEGSVGLQAAFGTDKLCLLIMGEVSIGDISGVRRGEDAASEIAPSLVTLNWIQTLKNNCSV